MTGIHGKAVEKKKAEVLTMKENKTVYAFTRTVTINKLNVMCVNTETSEVENRIVILKELPKKESALMSAISNAINDEVIKPVQVVDRTTETHRYGITEQAFYENAAELPLITRNVKED